GVAGEDAGDVDRFRCADARVGRDVLKIGVEEVQRRLRIYGKQIAIVHAVTSVAGENAGRRSWRHCAHHAGRFPVSAIPGRSGKLKGWTPRRGTSCATAATSRRICAAATVAT